MIRLKYVAGEWQYLSGNSAYRFPLEVSGSVVEVWLSADGPLVLQLVTAAGELHPLGEGSAFRDSFLVEGFAELVVYCDPKVQVAARVRSSSSSDESDPVPVAVAAEALDAAPQEVMMRRIMMQALEAHGYSAQEAEEAAEDFGFEFDVAHDAGFGDGFMEDDDDIEVSQNAQPPKVGAEEGGSPVDTQRSEGEPPSGGGA